jgi:predicted phosphodiesterase
MKNSVQNYRNILNDTRDISQNQKIQEEWDKAGTSATLESFKRAFYDWKKRNKTKVKKSIKKPQDVIMNAFEQIVNELAPDANPLGLPDSKENQYNPYKFPVNHNDILFLTDIHVPYHNIPALTAALKYGLENEVNTIYINGDLIDFYAISRFQKDPRKRDLASEIYMARDFLYTLRRLFPTQAIYFKAGNHDIRWDHYLINNASDLVGIEEFSLQSIMHLDKLNITFIPDKQLVRMGKLVALHGHEFGSSMFSPVNIARGLYLRAKDNAICGHHHQTSEHTEPNINGKVTTCWSVACLCELHPDYMPINKFTHGFAHVKVFDNDDFEVTNYRIVDGKIK